MKHANFNLFWEENKLEIISPIPTATESDKLFIQQYGVSDDVTSTEMCIYN